MYLHNYKFTLRSAEEKDANILTAWWNDGNVMEHAGFPYGLKTTIKKTIEALNRPKEYGERLIIEYDNIPVGEMSYQNLDNNIAEIGIKICNPNYQNQGYGPIYLKMLINYLFFELKKDKIILDTNLNNKRAQHVYEHKIGFTKTKITYNSWTDQLGNLQSAVCYELNKADYKKL